MEAAEDLHGFADYRGRHPGPPAAVILFWDIPNPHTESRLVKSTRRAQSLQLLAQTRQELGVTQVELAQLLRRPQSFVSKYESGERRLDIFEFMDVCAALGVSPGSLIERMSSEAANGSRRKNTA
jgi:ribosome-binding protein aMBF1 (putative translation factor)